MLAIDSIQFFFSWNSNMSQPQASLQNSPGGHEFEISWTSLNNCGVVQKRKSELKVDPWASAFGAAVGLLAQY